jgi:hypothetical protein
MNNASGRNQITFGIFEQNTLEDSLITKNPSLANHHSVKYKRIDPEYTDGVVWARKVNSLQIDNEDFFYQIDSHMLFDQDWDHFLILDYNLASKEENTHKIILTSSTKNFDFRDNVITKFIVENGDVSTDIKYFEMKKNLRLRSHGVWVKSSEEMRKSQHIFAGNFFTTCKWLSEVGYTPKIFFEGEEQMMVLTSYLAGYKIFSQRKIKAYHYVREEDLNTKPYRNPVIHQEKINLMEKRSSDYIMDFIYSIDEKVLQQFYIDMGVDYINKNIAPNTHLLSTISKASETC